MKKLYFSFVLLLCFSFVLGACSNTPSSQEQNNSTQSSSAKFPRTVKDSVEEVEIPAEPKRVISTAFPDNIVKLGVELVGTVPVADDDDGHYDHIAQYLQNTESIGTYGNFDFEKILSLDPDLIVLTTYDMDEEQVANLKAIAPVIRVDFVELSWQEIHIIIGQALGKEDLAQAHVEEYAELLAEKKPLIANAIGQQELLLITPLAKDFYVWGPEDPNDVGEFLYEDLGLPPPAKVETSSYTATLEGIAEIDPDILLVSGDKYEQQYINLATWKNLKAVKNNQVYVVSKDFRMKSYFPIGGTENLLELEKIFVKP